MRVKEILAVKGKVLYTITTDKKLAAAVATMEEQDIGSLACFEQGRMVGMLTFREIVKVLHVQGAAWGSAMVSDVMVRDSLIVANNVEDLFEDFVNYRPAQSEKWIPKKI